MPGLRSSRPAINSLPEKQRDDPGASVYRSAPGDDTERTWVGRVQIANVRSADDLARRMVGCAGAVAELCWRGEFVDPDYWTELQMMSPSDWHLSDCEPGVQDDLFENAIQEVAHLLVRDGPGWKMLIAESRRLIVSSRSSIGGVTLGQRSAGAD